MATFFYMNEGRTKWRLRAVGMVLAGLLVMTAAGAARAEQTPLFTHPDSGPISVMKGETGERLPLEETRPEVRDFVARANSLISQEKAAETKAIAAALDDGRALQKRLDTELVGTLYLEEGVRRLRRIRLGRIPVRETDVYKAYAGTYPERFDMTVVLRRAVDDLGVSYAVLAACLELAGFPNESGPRQVTVEDDGSMWTRVKGAPLAFDLVPFPEERMLIRSVVLGTTRSLGFKDKAQVTRFILDRCI